MNCILLFTESNASLTNLLLKRHQTSKNLLAYTTYLEIPLTCLCRGQFILRYLLVLGLIITDSELLCNKDNIKCVILLNSPVTGEKGCQLLEIHT